MRPHSATLFSIIKALIEHNTPVSRSVMSNVQRQTVQHVSRVQICKAAMIGAARLMIS